MIASGIFFAVAGPSGAGKDTLIRIARREFEGNEKFVFLRRAITRASDAGGEDHLAVTPEDFSVRQQRGEFALSWEAHGLAYGIPTEAKEIVSSGRHVIANLSRAAVKDAMSEFANVCVIMVTAPPDVLAERLKARGRESAATIQERRMREGATLPRSCEVVTVGNGTTPQEGGRRFVSVLLSRAGELA